MQTLNPIKKLLPIFALAFAAGLCPIVATAQLAPTQTVSGIIGVIHGDPVDASSPPTLEFYVVDEGDPNRWTALTLDETQIRDAGGLQALTGQRVTVTGTPLADATSSESLGLRVESLAIAPAAPAAAGPVSGNKRVLTIMCKFADIVAEPRDTWYFDALIADTYPGLSHYWGENSGNMVNLRGSFSTGWFTLPRPRAAYLIHTPGARHPYKSDRELLKADCRGLAESAGLDPSRFAVLNMMFNAELDGYRVWGGKDPVTGQGFTWIGGRYDQATVAHEMGHAFGLYHAGHAGFYVVTWDVMDPKYHGFRDHEIFGSLGLHLNAYHKDVLGWIPSAQKFTLPAGSTHTVTLERSALPFTTNYRMIKIPTTSGRFYTVEARQKIGYDKGDGVIVYEVDPFRENMPSRQVAATDGTALKPGQIFESPAADGVTVKVDSATNSGFVVTVSSALMPLTVAVAVEEKGKVTGPGIACGTGTANNCTAAYTPDRVVSLTATPFVNTQGGEDWMFDHWEGACTGTATTCVVTMSAARSVRAVFVE